MSSIRSWVMVPIVAGAVIACESGRVTPSGEAQTAPATAVAPVVAPRATATAAASAPTAAKASILRLRSGATVRLPAAAKPRRQPPGLPAVVRGAHNYTLPGGRQRLMVTELDLEGASCRSRLDAEWARMQEARKDTDPRRLALRQTSRVEQRTVAGHRVLYSEALQGTSLADAGRPFAAAASAFMCEGDDLLLIMYISDREELAAQVRPMIEAIVASYRPATPS